MEPRQPVGDEPPSATTSEPPPEGPAPPSLWATPPPAGNPRTSRLLLAIIWIAALLLAGFYAVIVYRTSSGAEGFRLGRAVGTSVGPFLFALIVRFVWVRIITRKRAGQRPILRSPSIPLGAVILIGLNLVTNASSLVASGPVGPTAAIRISGPYSLRPASADTAAIAEAGFKGNRTIRSYEVREVVGEDGSLSLLVVADGPMEDRTGAIESLARGMESASGLTATIEVIRDRRVAVAVGETLSIGAWIEEPFGIFVYAVTPTGLHQIIEAVLAAPRSTS
jgi:hypothetical protein